MAISTSRRTFLRLLGVSGALSATAACVGPAPENTPAPAAPADARPTETRSADATPTAEAKPAETRPAATAAATRPADARPTAEAKPADARPTESKPVDKPTAAPAPAKTATTGPAVTVELLHTWEGDHGGARAMAALAKRYEALKPNVKIKQTVVAGAEYERKQIAAFASGVVPDMTLTTA